MITKPKQNKLTITTQKLKESETKKQKKAKDLKKSQNAFCLWLIMNKY